jgi:dihydrofolate reductase
MKVILYADITLNGFIAKPDGNSDFTSAADVLSFNDVCRQAGCAIMGHTTFNYFNKPSNFTIKSLNKSL